MGYICAVRMGYLLMNFESVKEWNRLGSWLGEYNTTFKGLGWKNISEVCSSLTNLNLQNCKIKEIPREIGKLTSLRHLNLYNNKITHIPEEMGNCWALRTLNLSNNFISKLPLNKGFLNNLKYFYMANNPICKEINLEEWAAKGVNFII